MGLWCLIAARDFRLIAREQSPALHPPLPGAWPPRVVGSVGGAGLAVLLCSGWAGWWKSVIVCLSVPQIIFSEDYQQAEGRAWHKKHFACLECETLLAGKPFALHDASLLCATCSKSKRL